ncbi:MAG: transcriptional repressor, partial [Gammaproteobacteria bacterium]
FEGGHSVFEMSSEKHHDHIVCVRCGRVEEFTDEEIEKRQQVVADRLGFELTDHNLNMYGLCPDCR